MATESNMYALLRLRYPQAEYALFRHVPNGTGGSTTRTLDAMCMSLWPSRGLDIMGFEIKCSRSDWLTELRNPAKAEALAKYCDYFWLVVADDKIVKAEELPRTWGLLVANGTKLKIVTPAPKLDPVEMPRKQLAALLRVAQKTDSDAAAISYAKTSGYDEGYKAAQTRERKRDEESENYNKQRYEALLERVNAFQNIAGIHIDHWNNGNVGEAVKVILNNTHTVSQTAHRMREFKRMADDLATSIDSKIAALDEFEARFPYVASELPVHEQTYKVNPPPPRSLQGTPL